MDDVFSRGLYLDLDDKQDEKLEGFDVVNKPRVDKYEEFKILMEKTFKQFKELEKKFAPKGIGEQLNRTLINKDREYLKYLEGVKIVLTIIEENYDEIEKK